METGFIYGVRCSCHPEDGVRYVGQTSKGVEIRRAVHLWNARTDRSKTHKSHFSNWIRKHGEENVEFFTLEEPLVKDLDDRRSEEHTSELQSRGHLVCRLLLEKKNKKKKVK